MLVCKHGYDAAIMAFDAFSSVLEDDLSGRSVLIKPNVGRVSTAGTGVCTHPEVVRGVIAVCQERGAGRILVGDGSIWGVNAREAFEQTGIWAVCDEMGVECVDLDTYDSVVLPIPDGLVINKLVCSRLIHEVDMIISVPVMKTHMYTGVSLGIKNMKGCLYKMEKTKLHRLNKAVPDINKGRVLDYGIADMASVLMPTYTVIDATYALEGLGPSVGTPKAMNLVLASKDTLLCDMAAVELMGMKPSAISHLQLLAERRPSSWLYSEQVHRAEPRDFLRHAKVFEPASLSTLGDEYPHIRVLEKGTCSACSAAIMVFVRTHGAALLNEGASVELPYVLITGKDVADADIAGMDNKQMFCIGNCALNTAKRVGAAYCLGCPPVGSSILECIRGVNVEYM